MVGLLCVLYIDNWVGLNSTNLSKLKYMTIAVCRMCPSYVHVTVFKGEGDAEI